MENKKDILGFEREINLRSKNYLDKKDGNTVLFYPIGNLLYEDSNTYVNKEVIKNRTMNFNAVMISFDGRVRVCIEDNSFSKSFIYFLMNSKFIQNKITEFAKGTTVLHAKKSIKHFIMVISYENIRKTFDVIGERIFDKLLNNKLETSDLFLIKLTTGKIRVPLEASQ